MDELKYYVKLSDNWLKDNFLCVKNKSGRDF